jgi:hypothetical protein
MNGDKMLGELLNPIFIYSWRMKVDEWEQIIGFMVRDTDVIYSVNLLYKAL